VDPLTLRTAGTSSGRQEGRLRKAEAYEGLPSAPALRRCPAWSGCYIRGDSSERTTGLACDAPVRLDRWLAYDGESGGSEVPGEVLIPDCLQLGAGCRHARKCGCPELVHRVVHQPDDRLPNAQVLDVQFFTGEFQTVFHTDAATVAVVVNDTEKGVTELKRWTEWELGRLQAKASGEVFYFTQLTNNLSPRDLFMSPRFQVAFNKTPDALLPLTHAELLA
jgi:hypothetical protein